MIDIIVIAASAGGVEPLCKLIGAVPPACPISIFVVLHIGKHPSDLANTLSWFTTLRVSFAEDGERIGQAHVYVAPPDRHMLVDRERIHLNRGAKVNHTRPAADPLFVSAAESFQHRVLGIVLSGGDSDGAEGLRTIKLRGGRAIVQQPSEAVVPSMPLAAIARDHPDACLSISEIEKVMKSCGPRALGAV